MSFHIKRAGQDEELDLCDDVMCHFCFSWIKQRDLCPCENIAINHCWACHMPAFVVSYLPLSDCGVTVDMIRRDIGEGRISAATIRAAMRTAERRLSIVIKRRHVKKVGYHYWLVAVDEKMRTRIGIIQSNVVENEVNW